MVRGGTKAVPLDDGVEVWDSYIMAGIEVLMWWALNQTRTDYSIRVAHLLTYAYFYGNADIHVSLGFTYAFCIALHGFWFWFSCLSRCTQGIFVEGGCCANMLEICSAFRS